MVKCCIGFGNWSYFYRYIVVCIISNIIRYFSLYFCPILNKNNNNDNNDNNKLVKVIYKYLGFSIFGLLFLIIFKKKQRNYNKNINNDNKDNKNLSTKNYIFNT